MGDKQRQDAASILEDVFCMNCGYNLRTLRRESVCPECATPVADSTRERLLRFRNPEWLRQIHTGAYWLYNWVECIFLAALLARMSTATLRGVDYSQLLGGLAGMLGVLGVLRFTSEDPGRPTEDASESERRVARGALMTMVLATTVVMVAGRTGAKLDAILSCVWSASILVGVVGVRSYADGLARQTSSPAIVRSIGTFTFLGVAVAGASLAVHLIILTPSAQRNPTVAGLARVFTGISLLFWLLVVLRALGVLWAIRREFRKAARAK